MVKTLIFDISENTYHPASAVLCDRFSSCQIYAPTMPFPAHISIAGTVVIVDTPQKLSSWTGYAIIGLETTTSIYGVSYVIDDLSSCDMDFIERAYARTHRLPLTIATTGRLILREFAMSDFHDFVHLYRNPKDVAFLPALQDEATERQKLADYIATMYPFYEYGLWAIIEKSTGKLIGRAGIEHRTVNDTTYREIGYLIDADYRNMGYATECCNAILQFAKNYGMHELILYVNKKNVPSIALAKKLNFSLWLEQTDGTNEFYIFRKDLMTG